MTNKNPIVPFRIIIAVNSPGGRLFEGRLEEKY
jgi:hypothetical protein